MASKTTTMKLARLRLEAEAICGKFMQEGTIDVQWRSLRPFSSVYTGETVLTFTSLPHHEIRRIGGWVAEVRQKRFQGRERLRVLFTNDTQFDECDCKATGLVEGIGSREVPCEKK